MGLTAFITGCAGFIGSHLTDRLLAAGYVVVGYDNLSTGQLRFLDDARQHPDFHFVEGDVLDTERLARHMRGANLVFHLAANADVRHGSEAPRRDLEQNTIATHGVLEAMRIGAVREIAFVSSASVYGNTSVFPTPEDAPLPLQTSFYGASKLAAEGLIGAYCEAFGFRAWIFRPVSILGERYTHGHLFDFYRQLRHDARHLRVLGNGQQRKSYLYVQDCIDAMLIALEKAGERINVFNLGTEQATAVHQSVSWLSDALQLRPQVSYGAGDRGWIGDSPCILLDTARIRALGWRPRLEVREAVLKTIAYLSTNEWVLEART